MEKVDALEKIKELWWDADITLGEKIVQISNEFYTVGLDLPTTAAFIKATPVELDSMLALGGLDDEMIEMISKANPPKTTWQLIANASDEEIVQALTALSAGQKDLEKSESSTSVSEFVYQKMREVAGPTPEQLLARLTGSEIARIRRKGESFNALSDWDIKFLKSVASRVSRDNTLSEKQLATLRRILTNLADKGAIVRNSIDGDQDLCDKVLDALGRE